MTTHCSTTQNFQATLPCANAVRYNSSLLVALIFAVSFGLLACSEKGAGLRYPSANATDGQVCADLVQMPQNLTPYAQAVGGSKVLLDSGEQAEHVERMRQRFFSPWKTTEANKGLKRSLENNFNLRPDKAYGENLRPFEMDEWQRLRENANIAAYPARMEQAITVRNTSMRAMPTSKPFFLNPDKAGEGYPFDYFQHTAVWIGTPVFISHVSNDGAWVLAETRLTVGWIPAVDVAVVDTAFKDRWENAPLAAMVRDNIILAPSSGRVDEVTGKRPGVRAHIGTLLPLAGASSANAVLYPRRSSAGHAEIATASLGSGAAARLPLPITPDALARIGNEMMGQPYGWGGLMENRDCSAVMRDLFTPFGLWLPRNSATQGAWGRPVVLSGLTPDEKETRISAEAVPFFSLIWLRGHIGLYVGDFNGKPAMFHNVWGIRTVDESGDSGRAVIGKAVVTSLRPGAELPTVASNASILDRIGRVSIMPETDEKLPVIKATPKKYTKNTAGSHGKKHSSRKRRG